MCVHNLSFLQENNQGVVGGGKLALFFIVEKQSIMAVIKQSPIPFGFIYCNFCSMNLAL